jgi:hypothetical protein
MIVPRVVGLLLGMLAVQRPFTAAILFAAPLAITSRVLPPLRLFKTIIAANCNRRIGCQA